MKRIISFITAVLITASAIMPAAAEQPWITVSSWAYNSVSNFRKDGLLPESFNDVSDYTQTITREQFAELLYSTLVKSKCINIPKIVDTEYYDFSDTGNTAALALASYNIMTGESTGSEKVKTGTGSRVVMHYAFYPERSLTREEMAAVIYRAASRWCPNMLTESDANTYEIPSDADNISEWARESVISLGRANIIAGMEDGTFAPKSNLTIEQAVQVIYTLYNEIPATRESDGANIRAEGEQVVQTYENGLTETKEGDVLYLKKGDATLMEFETDIYSNVYSATVDGIVYAAAQNIFGKTDVYNAETGETVFRVARPVHALKDGYIITKTTGIPALYGACGYDGEEILPPEYSLCEIETIRENGWTIPEPAISEVKGWMYYINSSDRHLYRIDSNGENKQMISSRLCDNLEYINGRLYFGMGGTFYTIKPDGTDERSFKPPKWYDGFLDYRDDEAIFVENNIPLLESRNFSDGSRYVGGERIFTRIAHKSWTFHDSDSVYMQSWNSDTHLIGIWRIALSDGGVNVTEVTEGFHATSYKTHDGKIYFIDRKKSDSDEDGYADYGSLYCSDGGKVTLISDRNISQFVFFDGGIAASVNDEKANTVTKYLMDMDGSNMRIFEEYEDARQAVMDATPEGEPYEDMYLYRDLYEDLSDEKYAVYSEERTDLNTGRVYFTDRNGEETTIYSGQSLQPAPVKRIGDTLYYLSGETADARRGGVLMAYDMNAKKESIAAREVQSIQYASNADGRDWLTYTDYNYSIWRLNGVTGELDEVFPCKGINRHGRLQAIANIDGARYKVDTEGNYSLLTEDDMFSGCVYADNGAADGVHFF